MVVSASGFNSYAGLWQLLLLVVPLLLLPLFPPQQAHAGIPPTLKRRTRAGKHARTARICWASSPLSVSVVPPPASPFCFPSAVEPSLFFSSVVARATWRCTHAWGGGVLMRVRACVSLPCARHHPITQCMHAWHARTGSMRRHSPSEEEEGAAGACGRAQALRPLPPARPACWRAPASLRAWLALAADAAPDRPLPVLTL